METPTALPTSFRRVLPLLVVVVGGLLSLSLYLVWKLETRWFYVSVAGLAMVCVSLLFVRRFGDFLLVTFLFLVPLSAFQKWLFLDHFPDHIRNDAAYSGAANIGMMVFLLAGFYAHWFLQVFYNHSYLY